MSYSGDAAEQVVRIGMEGAEMAVRLAGSGAKQLAILLYAILKDQHKTRGKIRLTNMLRSGRELKVFAVQDKDLRLFCTEAKKYGVLYTVLKDRDANDGLTDIMVRAEDASKINRIFERYKLTTVEMGSVKSQTERKEPKRTKQKESKQEKKIADITVQSEKVLPELDVPEWMIAKKEDKTITQEPEQERALTKQEKVDEFLNEIFNVDAIKEEQNQNPTTGRTAESRQSEPSLKKSPISRAALSSLSLA